MWIVEEVQTFSKQHRLSAEVLFELCGLCARLITRALSEVGSEPAQTMVTHLDDLHATIAEAVDAAPSQHDAPILVPDTITASELLALDPDEKNKPTLDLGTRYKDLGLLGVGGMGEVRRVLDRDIGRRLAMKILKRDLLEKPRSVARFIEEAQIVGQLQHSGLVPVHEIGKLRDGRPYFTMREVRGRELGEIIADIHAASEGGHWKAGASGWTFRRLISAFLRVCEAVGYAHSKGVVHRDLKPSNILIGADDEVLVVDWGIAKVLSRPELQQRDTEDHDAVVTARSQDESFATQAGSITGTPAYMPPEQAFGQVAEIDARSDVYALGAILYQILSNRAPYKGPHMNAILLAVGQGPPLPVVEASAMRLPQELVEVCERAMSRNRDGRYASAKEVALAITDWLDNTKRREKALQLVDEALNLEQTATQARLYAETLRREGEALLAGVPSYAPEEQKHPGWAKEDDAKKLLQEADLRGLEADQRLHAALTYVPDLAEAHTQLARRYMAEHRDAEAKQQPDAVIRAEVRLRAHADALAVHSPDRQRFNAYLRGIGALTLWTDPPGAEVHLYRYVEKQRRLHEVFERVLGRTPLHEVALEPGSYLCVIQSPGFEPVRYPVFIERQQHWDGIRPGERDPFPIVLPAAGSLKSSEVYVPAGWFWAGGDHEAPGAIARRRLWVDRFVLSRFSVTNAEYIAFLDDLVAQGREEEALQHVPRERGGSVDELGAMSYGRDAQGRFFLQTDADGDTWLLDWPVLLIDWYGASAYCAHLAAKTGQQWQLPSEWAWEKAARGVDGRFFPWGNGFDASWCCMRDSHAGRLLPAAVDSFPVDVSPYGARGMAGNTRDWCAELYIKDGPPVPHIDLVNTYHRGPGGNAAKTSRRVVRGGSWGDVAGYARATFRSGLGPGGRNFNVGLRPARPFG